MARPLPLSVSKKIDGQEFLRLKKRVEKEGIGDLTIGEHKRLLELSCFDAYKEFESVDGDELKRRAERRITEGKRTYDLGRPPVPPFSPWKWDEGKRVYVWSAPEKPKDIAGSMEGVEYLPSYIERPNPFVESREGQILGEAA